jgi:hypothetical protein
MSLLKRLQHYEISQGRYELEKSALMSKGYTELQATKLIIRPSSSPTIWESLPLTTLLK